MTKNLPGAVFPTEVVLAGPRPGTVGLPGVPYTIRVE